MTAYPTIRACLITNPRSGRGGMNLSAVLPVLRAHGWEPEVRQKLHGGHAAELAQRAVHEGYDVVVNCGGDGTLSEIVDGVAGAAIAVGALPGGTENLWARELGIARRLDVAAMQLVGAVRRRVDVGRVTINGKHERHFVLMAGLGFDGAVMARVSKPLKNRVGPAAVGLAALRALPSFTPVPVRVDLDGAQWNGRVVQIVVGNTRSYGGFAAVTPDAYIDDGQLDLCLISATDALAVGRQAAALLLRHRPSAATSEVYRAARIAVHAPAALPMQVDGGAEDHDVTPSDQGVTYEFSLLPQGLTVLVPRTYDGALFQAAARAAALHAWPDGTVTDGGAESHDESKHRDRTLRVVAVGVESISAVRLRDGRPYTVMLGRKTALRDARGERLSPAAFLDDLHEGNLIRVKGTKSHGVIAARRITRR